MQYQKKEQLQNQKKAPNEELKLKLHHLKKSKKLDTI